MTIINRNNSGTFCQNHLKFGVLRVPIAHWAKFGQQVDMTCDITWCPMPSQDALLHRPYRFLSTTNLSTHNLSALKLLTLSIYRHLIYRHYVSPCPAGQAEGATMTYPARGYMTAYSKLLDVWQKIWGSVKHGFRGFRGTVPWVINKHWSSLSRRLLPHLLRWDQGETAMGSWDGQGTCWCHMGRKEGR